jgi:uncharacterized protein YyaL (SSP411 family)
MSGEGFALLSLDRVLRERFIDGELFHSAGVAAFLDDHIYLAEALVEAYETTAKRRYVELAEHFMSICLERFADADGGFFDTVSPVLGARLKRVEDVPHPSANAVAAVLLLRLHHITGSEQRFSGRGEKLEAFSGSAGHTDPCRTLLRALMRGSTCQTAVVAGPESECRASRSLSGSVTVVVYGEDRGRWSPVTGRPVSSR